MQCSNVLQCDFPGTQYQYQPPSVSTDRQCANITACQPGYIINTSATFTSDQVCLKCAPGTKFVSLSSPCQPCGAGSTDLNSDPLSPCRDCDSGKYVPPGSFGACPLFPCPPGKALPLFFVGWKHDFSGLCFELMNRVLVVRYNG